MKAYNEDDYLMMSGIQHFCFCRRQWALIHLEQQWSENVRTASGRVEHKNCHDEGLFEKRGSLLIIRALRVVSHRLKLSGECDVVEFREDSDGINIQYAPGRWQPMPVEYKHGKEKDIDVDRLQLCAQAMALEEMLACHIPEGVLFYHETRKREKVILTEELRQKTQSMADEMYQYYSRGYTPKVKTGTHCRACSLNEICLPVLNKNKSAAGYIEKALEMEE